MLVVVASNPDVQGGGVVWEIRTNPDKGREGGSKIQDFAGRPK